MSASARPSIPGSSRSSRLNPSSVNVECPKLKWSLPHDVLRKIEADAAVTRNSKIKPYCSCYGLERTAMYPDHYFCHRCQTADEIELEKILHNKKNYHVNRHTNRYLCTANHESWKEPTHLIISSRYKTVPQAAGVLPSKRKSPPTSTESSPTQKSRSSEYVAPSISVTPQIVTRVTDKFPTFESIYEERNRRLNNELERNRKLQDEVDRLRKFEKTYNAQTQKDFTLSLHSECSPSSRSRPTLQQALQNSIKRTIKENYDRHLPATCGKAIADAVWDETFLDGIALPRLKQLAKKESDKEMAKLKPAEALRNFIEGLHKAYPRYSKETIEREAANACWSETILDGELHTLLFKKASKHFRTKYFSGPKIQKKIDLAAPRLNLEGVRCMRELQTEADPLNKDSYSHTCAIVSNSTVQRAGKKANKYCQRRDKIPYRYVEGNTGGGSFYFNTINMLKFLFKAHGLDKIAEKHSVEISITFDAAQLTKNITQIMAGIKLIDPRTRCPITGVLLLLPTDPNAKFQSVFNCWPLRICIGKETSALLDEHFKPLFDLFLELSKPGQQIIPEWEHLIVSTPIDMAAKWKGLMKGGGCKIHSLFCCHCALTSNMCHHPNALLCERCTRRHTNVTSEGPNVTTSPDNVATWKCHHHDMLLPKKVEELKARVLELRDVVGREVDKIPEGTTIQLLPANDPDRTTNSLSVDFSPSSSKTRRDFIKLVTKELTLREISHQGRALDERVTLLRECLEAEAEAIKIRKELEHAEVKPGAFLDLLKSIPCILHLENRVAIKVLTTLLVEGLCLADKGGVLEVEGATSKKRMENYMASVETHVNEISLGTQDNPTQWRFPFETSTDLDQVIQVGTIYLSNTRSRKIMDSVEPMIDLSIKPQERESWKKALREYKEAVVILRKRGEDYTQEEMDEFQDKIDRFYQIWVRLHGRSGVTNYIHDLASGHVLEYMQEWGNLNKYSQQGWEALNKMVKAMFFKMTNHGGGGRTDNVNNVRVGCRHKLLPIVKIFQRRALWISGEGDALFLSNDDEIEDRNDDDTDDPTDTAFDLEDWQ